jgi:hypothetical protein
MPHPIQTIHDSNTLTQFRPRREGPEALIQDIVAEQIPELFCPRSPSWTAASVPLGAGIPDLVVVSYYPEVFALTSIELSDAQILAYLRTVGKARLDTIAKDMGISTKKMRSRLSSLMDIEAIEELSDIFFLSSLWRRILPEIITIEVKVSKWPRAIRQAARNRIFAHRSFVALPENIALRIRTEPVLGNLGIGLISVSDATATVIKRPCRRSPNVWTYYYRLASLLARSRPY